MDKRLVQRLASCEICACQIVTSQAYCRRCGRRLVETDAAPGRPPIAHLLKSADVPSPIGLPQSFEPLSWFSDGKDVILAHEKNGAPCLTKLSLKDDMLVPELLAAGRPRRELRGFAATRRGVFMAAPALAGSLASTTVGDSDPTPAPAELLPGNPPVVGLAAAASGEIHVLTYRLGRLTLWAGSGGRPLRQIASAGAGPERECWMRLFVASDAPGRGVARFWGGGREGHVDLELGAMTINHQPAAPDEPTALDARGPLHAHTFQATELTLDSVVPVPTTGSVGWGLLRLGDGAFRESADETAKPLALTSHGRLVVCQMPQTTLVMGLPSEPRLPLEIRRLGMGRRSARSAVAVATRWGGIVALEADPGSILLYDVGLDARDPAMLTAEMHLGPTQSTSTLLHWFPPMRAESGLWLLTVGGGVDRFSLWRLNVG